MLAGSARRRTYERRAPVEMTSGGTSRTSTTAMLCGFASTLGVEWPTTGKQLTRTTSELHMDDHT